MATYSYILLTQNWPTGIAANLFYLIESADGTDRIARTQANIEEIGGGMYKAIVTLNEAWGVLLARWDNGVDFAGETLLNVAPANSGSVQSHWSLGGVAREETAALAAEAAGQANDQLSAQASTLDAIAAYAQSAAASSDSADQKIGNPETTLAEAIAGVEAGGGASAEELAQALAGRVNVIVWSPATGWSLSLFRGDSYAEALAIPVSKQPTETHWPSELEQVHFSCAPTPELLEVDPNASSLYSIECIITTASGGGQAFKINLTSDQTQSLSCEPTDAPNGGYTFWLVANKDSAQRTLRSGPLTIALGAAPSNT